MVFHSFRHGFKDLCRQAQISDEVSDALSGHVSGKVSRRYGATNYPLAPLVGAVAKIRVPGLQLPRKSMQKVSQHA
jgi:integrase